MQIATVEFFIDTNRNPRLIFTELRTGDAYHEHMIGHLAGIITGILTGAITWDNVNGYDMYGLSTDVPAHVAWPKKKVAKGLIPVGRRYIADNFTPYVDAKWMDIELDDKKTYVIPMGGGEPVNLATIRFGWGKGQKPRDMVRTGLFG